MLSQEKIDSYLLMGQGDEYRLKSLPFVPDVIYDIGADLGSFTRFASDLFPTARIIAVEPNPQTYPLLKEYADCTPGVTALQAAVGTGAKPLCCPINKDVEPLHWMVLEEGSISLPDDTFEKTDIPQVTLKSLYEDYGGENYVLKIDCESAELALIQHKPSSEIIRNSAYFAAEIHLWARRHVDIPQVASEVLNWIWELAQTHTVDLKLYGCCILVWAIKRNDS